MTLALATIPDESDRLSRWLEAHMVGGDLRRLATELAAVHRAKPPADSVRAWLGSTLPEILSGGMSALPSAKIRRLLSQPYYLMELQEIVLLEGGPYWDSVPRPPEMVERTRAAKEWIEEAVFARYAEPLQLPEPATASSRRAGWKRTLWTVAVTAASVCIATFAASRYLDPHPAQVEVAWGWAKPNAFPNHLSRAAYLNRLAAEADEWFNLRPRTVDEAAKRLTEFRRGCTAILLAPHPQLTPADLVWLQKHCRAWREKVDKELIDLENDRDVTAVLRATDAIVRDMAQELRVPRGCRMIAVGSPAYPGYLFSVSVRDFASQSVLLLRSNRPRTAGRLDSTHTGEDHDWDDDST